MAALGSVVGENRAKPGITGTFGKDRKMTPTSSCPSESPRTAVAVAALTLYDMVKAADRTMVIGEIRLLRKTGGRRGTYVREEGQ